MSKENLNKLMTDNFVLETPSAMIKITDESQFYISARENSVHDETSARRVLTECEKLVRESLPTIIDFRKAKKVHPSCLEIYFGQEGSQTFSSVALIFKNKFQKKYFEWKIQSKNFPVGYFSLEGEAISWLKNDELKIRVPNDNQLTRRVFLAGMFYALLGLAIKSVLANNNLEHILLTIMIVLVGLGFTFMVYLMEKHREKAQKADERYNLYSSAINETALVSETDLQGRITYVNERFEEVSKFSAAELLGMDHRILNSGEHTKLFFHDMWKTIKSGRHWTGEIKNRAKDGSYYWVNSTIHPKVSKEGITVGFISIRFDITEKKKQEFEIIRARNNALRAEKAKTQFLANMSHEIRTPMNGILGMVQLLSETELTHEQEGMLETTKTCGDSLLTILNDILDISKIESGKLDLELINFNLNKCIEEAIFLSMNKATQKGIYLSFEALIGDDSWFIGDITRIRQIIVNFLSNAVKFTDEGGVQVQVDLKPTSEMQYQVEIIVKDSGIGMTERQTQRLFQAFTQVDSSTTRKYGGTGLGLFICYKLADAMGGEIKVSSELNNGTTMSLVLPMTRGEAIKEVKKKLKIEDKKNLAEDYPHKILLVEDNNVNQKLAKIMLKKNGYDCDIAGNGIEALKAFETLENQGQSLYTIVFMDMQMPEMDGLEATRALKAKYKEDTPPIVAMTANVFAEDKAKCFEAGMSDFIPKPVKQDEFRKVLRKFSTLNPNDQKKVS